MPYKDKETAKVAARDRQRKHRQGVTGQGVTWETIPLEDIKTVLLDDIVGYILKVGERYGNTEQRLRRAYKYHLWHDKNFINGVHKDLVEATR
ncbi:unnamed protein product [marine sediment metagenome]|uniref:Uncharacterized protein n=1 Tax=marine sediment metagenome TaxID=412755 RepID=X0U101_9ZZZZ